MKFERLRHLLGYTRSLSLWQRYLAATVLVLLAALIRWLLAPYLLHYPYILFLGAVTLCGLFLNTLTSTFAALLSALIVTLFFMEPRFSMDLAGNEVVAMFVFLATSLVIAAATETVRLLADTLDNSERQKDILLNELHHRTRNNLQIITSLINMQTAETDDPAVRHALTAVAERVITIGRLNQHLFGPAMEELERIDGREFLGSLCADLQLSLVGPRPITIACTNVQPVSLERDIAGTVAIAVNELVTNSLKHGFPDNRSGTISVGLAREGDATTLTVADDGVGCPAVLPKGSGLNLVKALLVRHRGTMAHEDADPGCRVVLRLLPAR